MSKEHVEYKLNPIEVARKVFTDPKLTAHLVYDQLANEHNDDTLSVSVTHDGTKGNEGHIVAKMLWPLIKKQTGTQFGVPVRVVWHCGDLCIQEKRGKVVCAGRLVDGVAQHYTLPIRMEIKK